ncbi:MAG: sigma-70 family RNA polymerase sigma factor [Halieaceae bacterium]|nr:sigma-70 family RNA polymerase sigma factor [Halieaceae bacterium]
MPTNFSDKQLVTKSRQGDKRAFDMLVMRYQNRLSAVISRYCKSSLDTEDIVQEAFIKAYRGIGNFRGDSAFYTWLCRIGINVAKNHLTSSARHLCASETSSTEEVENNYDSGSGFTEQVITTEGNIFGDELIDIIQSAISSLPEELGIALTLREIEGLSYDDISSMMACPIGTVRSRIFRAREVLNLKIKKYTQS